MRPVPSGIQRPDYADHPRGTVCSLGYVLAYGVMSASQTHTAPPEEQR